MASSITAFRAPAQPPTQRTLANHAAERGAARNSTAQRGMARQATVVCGSARRRLQRTAGTGISAPRLDLRLRACLALGLALGLALVLALVLALAAAVRPAAAAVVDVARVAVLGPGAVAMALAPVLLEREA